MQRCEVGSLWPLIGRFQVAWMFKAYLMGVEGGAAFYETKDFVSSNTRENKMDTRPVHVSPSLIQLVWWRFMCAFEAG